MGHVRIEPWSCSAGSVTLFTGLFVFCTLQLLFCTHWFFRSENSNALQIHLASPNSHDRDYVLNVPNLYTYVVCTYTCTSSNAGPVRHSRRLAPQVCPSCARSARIPKVNGVNVVNASTLHCFMRGNEGLSLFILPTARPSPPRPSC